MIISTQRPDTKIVTGSIKANFPTRIAFRTTTGTDSRVILDRIGAERLTGKGDMLFFQGSDLIRVQCAYTSTEDVISMCEEMKDEYDNCHTALLPSLTTSTANGFGLRFDHLYQETIDFLPKSAGIVKDFPVATPSRSYSQMVWFSAET